MQTKQFTKGKLECHSATNGDHIWQGNSHIADISDDGCYSKKSHEYAKLSCALVNAAQEINPQNTIAVAQNLKDMYDSVRAMLNVFDRELPEGSIGWRICKDARSVLSTIEQKEG